MNNKTTHLRISLSWLDYFWILTLILITLKLIGQIEWPWWQVLLPLWAPYAVALPAGIIAGTWDYFRIRRAKR